MVSHPTTTAAAYSSSWVMLSEKLAKPAASASASASSCSNMAHEPRGERAALGPSPSTWLPVLLPHPAATRSALMAAAFAKNATCIIGASGVGDCLIDGKSLAEELERVEILPTCAPWR